MQPTSTLHKQRIYQSVFKTQYLMPLIFDSTQTSDLAFLILDLHLFLLVFSSTRTNVTERRAYINSRNFIEQ